MFRALFAIIGLVLLAACSSTGVPRVTPTVAPTDTPTATDSATEIAQQVSRTPLVTMTPVVPTATDTVPPTQIVALTDSPTPLDASATPSATPTWTVTPSPTATTTPSMTNTPNPSQTYTATATRTPLPSATSTLTLTITPASTATMTPSITVSPLPLPGQSLPTETPTATTSPTPTWSPTPSITPSPPPPTVDDVATIRAQETELIETLTALAPTVTQTPLPTAIPPTVDSIATFNAESTAFISTLTAIAPTVTPTPSAPPPTLDVTPKFITAAPDTPVPPDDIGIITPIPGDVSEPAFVPTATIAVPTNAPIPTVINRSDTGAPGGSGGNTGTLDFSVGPNVGGIISGGLMIQRPGDASIIPGVTTGMFYRSPSDPNDYVVINNVGVMYTVDENGPRRETVFPFVAEVTFNRIEDNNLFVSDAAWTRDGSRVAYVLDSSGSQARPRDQDGVWVRDWNTGAMTRMVFDCPEPGHRACLVESIGFHYRSTGVEWSPDGNTLLVEVEVTRWYEGFQGEKGALLVVPWGHDPYKPYIEILYDYGAWSVDGQRLIVSGAGQSGAVVIGSVNPDGSGEQIIFNASAVGWWVQDAVQQPGGRIVALGRQGDRNGPLQIIDQNGTPLTGPIGTARPDRVEWSPDRAAVLIEAGGRTYVAYVNGSIQDVTDSLAGATAINWIAESTTGTQTTTGESFTNPVPSGVVEGSRFSSGQQVRVLYQRLNLRIDPDTVNDPIGSVFFDEVVTILSGPINAEGIEWWYIQTTDGRTGWAAGLIEGEATLG